MQPNLSVFERSVRVLLGAVLLYAAVVLFENWAARLLIGLFGLLALGEAVLGFCWLYAKLGIRSTHDKLSSTTSALLSLSAIQLVIAYEWWSAGFAKVFSPKVIATMSTTLSYFASKNPFPSYKNFLLGPASENATLMGYLVTYGELAVGLGLFVCVAALLFSKSAGLHRAALIVSIIALVAGAFMNAHYYFAAGWTSPSTSGINILMFWIQGVLAYFWTTQLLSEQK